MTQLREIAEMARILMALAENAETRALELGKPEANALRKSVIEGIRWHVRGLFVAAFSETEKQSEPADEQRTKAARILDDELVRLGNVIRGVTTKVGPLYFPSEPFKKD